jgi:hypothetical protein
MFAVRLHGQERQQCAHPIRAQAGDRLSVKLGLEGPEQGDHQARHGAPSVPRSTWLRG